MIIIYFFVLFHLFDLSILFLLTYHYHYSNIGFPGQIRKFDNQIQFNFIQIRQILSCRENYHSYSFSYHSI